MRMLVVEDEKDLNSIICSKLVKEGYNVDACYDGQAALDFIEMTEYDGVIMDIMIPHVNGIEVLKTIRAETPYTICPFFVIGDVT